MFNDIYNGKKVLVTGHTGFKGSWLSVWLKKLGADVVGLSDCIPTSPSHFEIINLEKSITHYKGDIRDSSILHEIIQKERPDFIFHLAAQAIVSASYYDPINTITTNVVGTANLLDQLRTIHHDCCVVIVTSDKCYENVEWPWGYKETDRLGGKDIYSGSKAAAEAVFHSYFHSFFSDLDCNIRLGSGRAGNVIGGGDWADNRIIVDCMKSWSNKQCVEIRSPDATRPWQHVLEPLSGYLSLGQSLYTSRKHSGQSFNFGPCANQNRTVLQLLYDLAQYWDFNDPSESFKVVDQIPFNEAGLLKLNCDKALSSLNWQANLSYDQCVKLVSKWYLEYFRKGSGTFETTLNQILFYEEQAILKKLNWSL